jgi:hypothetical protein
MFKYANNASTTLAAQIDGNATQITVLSAAGFPALTGGDSFHVTLESVDGLVREICLVTAVAGNVFDVTRGQDATTPQTFYVGATVAHRLVAEDLRTIHETYLPLAGGTMTGQITLPGGGTGDQAVTYDEVAALVNGIPPPVLDDYVEKAGDTMTGALTLAGAPTQALHAATKAYADLHLPLTGGTLSGTLTLPGGGTGDQAVTYNDVSGRLIPAGGGPGFALVKASSNDYDVTWSWLDISSPNPLPLGGTTGQALVKLSNDDYDVAWDDVGGGGSGLPAGATFGQMLMTLRDDNDQTQLTQYWTDFLDMPVLGEAMHGYAREVYATTVSRNAPQLSLGDPTVLKNPAYGRRSFLQVDISNTGLNVTLQPPNIDYQSFIVFNGTYWWEYRKIPTIDPDTGEQVWDYTDPDNPFALWDYEPAARDFTLSDSIAGLNIIDVIETTAGGSGDWDGLTLSQYEFTLGYLKYQLGNAWDYTRLGYGHVAPNSNPTHIPLFALRRINNWTGLNESQVVGITESLTTSTSLTTALGFQKWLNEGPTLLHYASKRREMSRFKNVAEMFDPFYESEIYDTSPPTHLWLYPIQMELNGQVAAFDYLSGYSYLACSDLDTGVWNMFHREWTTDSTSDNTLITYAGSELAVALPGLTNVACVDKDNTGTYGAFGEIPTDKFALYHVIATFADMYMTTAEGYYATNKLFAILSEPYDTIGDAYDDAERHLNQHMNALVGNVFLSARPLASFIVDHTGLIRETPASDFQSLQDLTTGTRKQIRWIPKFGRGREYVLYDRTIEPTVVSWGVGASGATEFTQLTDAPNTYTGSGGYVVKVKSTEDGLEFAAGGGGVTDHGALTGLSDDDHTQYALADGTRGSFAAVDHDHDGDYAAIGHDHSGVYQPADADLTALAGLTVAENALIVGDDTPTWTVLSPPTPAGDGHFLKISGLGVLEWAAWSNPAPGVEEFIDLTDTPTTYTGAAGYVVKVKSTEDGLEFAAAGAGGVTDHGALTGLSDDDHSQYALADGTRGAFQRYENGFPNRTDSTISFTDGTLTFSIAPAVTSFTFTSNMVRYTKSSAQTVVISDTEGLHFIYFDSAGTLQETTTFSEALILTYALVAVVYWDATNNQHLLLADERHGDSMSAVTHLYHHVTEGTRYETGLGLGDMVVDGNGNVATHAQFSVANGVIWDEDLRFTITDGSPQDLAPTAQLPIFYRSGATAWRRIAATGYCVTTTGSGRAAYNQNVAGSWQLTEVTNNDFVLMHVVATNDTEYPVVLLCGQSEYATLNAAQVGAQEDAKDLALGGLDGLWPEWVLLATVIVQTSSGYSNAVKSRVVSTADGASYIDWRVASTAGIGGISVSDHGQLAGLSDDDHTQYALADGTRGSFAAVTHYHDSDYISIVSTPTTGNFPTLTAGGELANSTYGPSSFATSGHDHSGVYQPLDGQLTDIAGTTPTKGNILVGDGTNWITLGVGTNAYVLTADSAQTSGVKWATLPSGVTDHGALTGLSDDDHTQYVLVDGTRQITGKLGMGAGPYTDRSLAVAINGTATSHWAVTSEGTLQSTVTGSGFGFFSNCKTAAASFSVTAFKHFTAYQSTLGASSAVASQYGFFVDSSMVGATNNYGFYGDIATAANRWNLYMAGTAPNYLAGSLGIGSTTLTGSSLVVGKDITGATDAWAIQATGTIKSDVTSSAKYYRSTLATEAASFTVGWAYHFVAEQGTIGASSTVTRQYGFTAAASLVGATENYGFYGSIPAAANRWNLYMGGTAANYLAGTLSIGTTADVATAQLHLGGNVSANGGNVFGVHIDSTVQSGTVSECQLFRTNINTQAASFTVSQLKHFVAVQGTKGAGSTITSQYGFLADSSLTGGTNNYGFFGNIAAASSRWNLYMNGTALNYLAGALLIATTTDNTVDKLQVNGTAVVTAPAAGANNTQVPTTAWVRTYAAGAYQPLDSDLTTIAALSPTKGNLMVGNGSAWVALGVGTNNYVLTADSAQASGVKWAAAAAGVTDHGALTGLADDDHTQYALVSGARALTALRIGTLNQATGTIIYAENTLTGATNVTGANIQFTGSSQVTNNLGGFNIQMSTAAGTYTVAYLKAMRVAEGTKGSGSTISNFYGFIVEPVTYASYVYAFYGAIAAGSNKWNLFMGGTAINYLGGALLINNTSDDTVNKLQVTGTAVVTAPSSDANNTQVPTTAWVRTYAAGAYQPLDAQLTDVASTTPTKGNVLVGNGTNWVTLGVGTNNYVLTADSAQTNGVKWAAATGVTDHGALTGLTDDDHTLYALADGTRGSFASTTHNHDSDYISIVGSATAGNFPTLTAGGELANSTYGPSSFATAGHDHASTYQPLDSDLTTLAGLTVAKGAFIVGSATPAWSVLSVGADNTILVADSAQTPGVKWTADINPDNVKVNKLAYFDEVYSNGNSGTAKTIDWTLGNKQSITMTGNCTFTFTAPTGPCDVRLKITQDGTGGRAITWPTSVKWPGGVAPTLSTTANDLNVVSLFYDGTNYLGTGLSDFS